MLANERELFGARAHILFVCVKELLDGKKRNEFFLLKSERRDLFQRQICLRAAFVMFFNS